MGSRQERTTGVAPHGSGMLRRARRVRALWQPRISFDFQYVPVEKRRAYRLACVLFWSVLLYFAFQRYVITFDVILERSMEPTLSEGQAFLVNRYLYHVRPPRRGEVVALRVGRFTDEQYIKRIIALEGDVLLIRRGTVSVNGRRLKEPYVAGPTRPDLGPARIPPGLRLRPGRQPAREPRQPEIRTGVPPRHPRAPEPGSSVRLPLGPGSRPQSA